MSFPETLRLFFFVRDCAVMLFPCVQALEAWGFGGAGRTASG